MIDPTEFTPKPNGQHMAIVVSLLSEIRDLLQVRNQLPVSELRHLELLTPEQFGVLINHERTSVYAMIRRGDVKTFDAGTRNALIHRSEVDAFIRRRLEAEDAAKAKEREELAVETDSERERLVKAQARARSGGRGPKVKR